MRSSGVGVIVDIAHKQCLIGVDFCDTVLIAHISYGECLVDDTHSIESVCWEWIFS